MESHLKKSLKNTLIITTILHVNQIISILIQEHDLTCIKKCYSSHACRIKERLKHTALFKWKSTSFLYTLSQVNMIIAKAKDKDKFGTLEILINKNFFTIRVAKYWLVFQKVVGISILEGVQQQTRTVWSHWTCFDQVGITPDIPSTLVILWFHSVIKMGDTDQFLL